MLIKRKIKKQVKKILNNFVIQCVCIFFVIILFSSCQSKLRGENGHQYFIKNKMTKNEYAYNEWVDYFGKLLYFNSDGYVATKSELPYGYRYDDNMCVYRENMEIVKFGKYEQDGNDENGAEDIEWIIIDENESSYKLLSLYGLDCKLFTNIYSNDKVLWKDSYIRDFLNNDFMNIAFNKEEKKYIIETSVENIDVDRESTDDTKDYVYLLSEDEIYRYFPMREQRICHATLYAKKEKDAVGAYTLKNGECIWMSRTPCTDCTIVGINCYGEKTQLSNSSGYDAMRPAIWVKKDSKIYDKSKE